MLKNELQQLYMELATYSPFLKEAEQQKSNKPACCWSSEPREILVACQHIVIWWTETDWSVFNM